MSTRTYTAYGNAGGGGAAAAGVTAGQVFTWAMLVAIFVAASIAMGFAIGTFVKTNDAIAARKRSENAGVMNFIVFDLLSDDKLERASVVKILAALEKATVRDFAPHWGVSARFHLQPRGSTSAAVPHGYAAVYLFDASPSFITSLLGRFAGFHSNAGAGENGAFGGNGPQPGLFIEGVTVPNVPDQTPFAIVPYGDPDVGYGAVLNTPAYQRYGRDLANIEQAFAHVISHEVMEILGNPYATSFSTPSKYYASPPTANGYQVIWPYEVADPVEFGTTSRYFVDGIPITNFVLPTYFSWSNSSEPGVSYDFLDAGAGALTPWSGTLTGLEFNLVTGCFKTIALTSNYTHPAILHYEALGLAGGPCLFGESYTASENNQLKMYYRV